MVIMGQAQSDVRPPSFAPLAGTKILVVEDHDDSRQLIRMLLRQAGAEVVAAANPAEGYRLFVDQRPDLLVSDIGMPEETGYDLLRKIRRLGPESGGRTPAIALTAWTRNEEISQAFRAGFQIHVPKPLNGAALVRAILELLDQSADS